MEQSYNALVQRKMIIYQINQSNYKIQSFLTEKSSSADYGLMKSTKENREIAKHHLLILYKVTGQILSSLNLIDEIKTTVTYIDDDGNYYRMGDFEIEDKDVSLSGGALKMSEAAIRKEALKRQQESKDAFDKINQHFKAFSRPYYQWERKTKTGWTVNRGVAAEAFERHWEEMGHSLEKTENFSNRDFGSVGHRWVLYLLSSGSDAYYTGPDTLFSQVKNYNATIIHNLDTVLNAVDFIRKILNREIDVGEQKQQIKNALSQSEQTNIISQKVWEAASKTAKKAIAKELIGTSNYQAIPMSGGKIKITEGSGEF